jgi:hypothetical protein
MPAKLPANLPTLDTITCGNISIKRPELRGLHLGMTIEEIKAVKSSLRASGASNVGEQYGYVIGPEKGVDRIRLEFLDGHLTSIEVAYDNSVKWQDEQQFLSRIAESFGLPKPLPGFRGGLLECKGLNLDAEYHYGIDPQVHLYDPSAKSTVERRRAEIEEKKRREFKP